MTMNKAEKTARHKNPLLGKPNWVATVLVAVLLIGGFCYLSDDVFLYKEAYLERKELAASAEQAILYRAGTTTIDLSEVEEKAEEISQKVQSLADKTDIGEYFAENDLTAEGRDENVLVLKLIVGIFVAGTIYLAIQVIRILAWPFNCRKEAKKNSKQTDNVG